MKNRKPAHQPGPWECEVVENIEIDPGLTVAVYDVRSIDDQDHCRPPTLAEAHANARLIAAAPEMLEALEHIYKELELDLKQGNCISMVAMGQVQAAIRKAKGESV